MPVAKKQAAKEAGGRNKGGRPKQETPTSLENRVLEYFEHCESLGRFPTESGNRPFHAAAYVTSSAAAVFISHLGFDGIYRFVSPGDTGT